MCGKYFYREWIILVSLYSIVFCVGLHCSLLAPFYPSLAISKGTSATIYGLVLGVFEFVIFISAPLFGKYVGKIGVKTLLNCGGLTFATLCILFGFLDKISSETIFVILSFVFRTMAALGYAAYVTAVYTIFSYEFTDTLISTIMAINESLFGIGLLFGPAIGGYLYEHALVYNFSDKELQHISTTSNQNSSLNKDSIAASKRQTTTTGGYGLPFWTVGGLSLLTSLVASVMLPLIENITGRPFNVLPLLKIVPIALNCFVLCTAAVSVGFVQTLLEVHLKQFNLRPLINSLVFVVNGAAYGLSNFVWSYVVKKIHAKLQYCIGGLIIIIGFIILGPASFIPLKPQLWLVIVALVLQGAGSACNYLATLIDCNYQVVLHGYPNNIETRGLISGLWISAQCIGFFSGQILGGFLYDELGFRNAVLVVICMQIAVICTCIFHSVCYHNKVEDTKL